MSQELTGPELASIAGHLYASYASLPPNYLLNVPILTGWQLKCSLSLRAVRGLLLKIVSLCANILVIIVMIFYDIAITLGDEIERIWLRQFTPMTVLWVMVCRFLYAEVLQRSRLIEQNRYLSPLGFIVVITCKPSQYSLISDLTESIGI